MHSNTIRHWSQYKNNTLSNRNLLRWRSKKKLSPLHISIHRNVRVDWQFVSTRFRVGRPFLISMKNIFHSYLFFGPYWKRSLILFNLEFLTSKRVSKTIIIFLGNNQVILQYSFRLRKFGSSISTLFCNLYLLILWVFCCVLFI